MKTSKTAFGGPVFDSFRGASFVVKLGGDPLTEPRALDSLASDLAVLRKAGIRLVVVHGGGSQLSNLSDRMGLETKKVNGRRITDLETLKLAKMVFAGEISTDIVAALRRYGIGGVGLSGVDGGLIDAVRRPPVRVFDRETGKERMVDFEHVGDIHGIDPSLLDVLLDGGFVPVVASLAADASGSVLNVNADTVAADVAIGLGAGKLILISDVPGLLRDREDRGSRIARLSVEEVRELVESGAASGGMVPKLENAIRTIEAGVSQIHIIDGYAPHALLDEVRDPGSHGTFIVTTPEAVSAGKGLA